MFGVKLAGEASDHKSHQSELEVLPRWDQRFFILSGTAVFSQITEPKQTCKAVSNLVSFLMIKELLSECRCNKREVLLFYNLIQIYNVVKLYLREQSAITVHSLLLPMDSSAEFFDRHPIHLVIFICRILKEA
jgi:hypothetical protein